MDSTGYVIQNTVDLAVARIVGFIPQFLAGLIILIVGLLVASILKALILKLFQYLKIDEWFARAKIDQAVKFASWPNIIGEVVRWGVVIIFLIPAVEAWGLPQVTAILNQLLLYIPNVFVAVVVAFVGLAVANIVSDIVRSAATGMGSSGANLLATIARYSIMAFTTLVVLNQLGVAADLIRILFTGFVAMIAIAGGLAFGLGGQDTARTILDGLRSRIQTGKVPIRRR